MAQLSTLQEMESNEREANINSTRRERFVTVATRRTENILENLRKLGNCSAKNNYEYSDEDVKEIFDAITAAVKSERMRFEGNGVSRRFRLRSSEAVSGHRLTHITGHHLDSRDEQYDAEGNKEGE